MLQRVCGVREESDTTFPQEFDVNFAFLLVCSQVIHSAEAIAELKLTVEVII